MNNLENKFEDLKIVLMLMVFFPFIVSQKSSIVKIAVLSKIQLT
jgi:hypothetical protein